MRDVVGLARAWIGTPYHHRASRQGAGADCLGLIFGIWRARYGRDMQVLPEYTPHWSETGPDERLWRGLAQHFAQVRSPRDGQLLLFRLQPRAIAKHLGIQTQAGRGFVHTCPRAGVIEAPLSQPWARRIVARFEFPPLTSEME